MIDPAFVLTPPPAPAHLTEPPNASLEHLAGSIERITFHNKENGFCVLRVKMRSRAELVTVVGNAVSVTPGEYIDCDGNWVNDRSHGLQFAARYLRLVPPSTREGIERYLGSGMVRGIGPHFAKKLVAAFGEQVFSVIEQTPERLQDLPGIGPKRRGQVEQAWNEQKVIREIMVFLQSHGVGTGRAVRIYKTYGNDAIERVRENPYRLALDINGIGFKTADAIAMRLGIPIESSIRAQAGVRHVLQEYSVSGHCAASRTILIESATDLLTIPAPIIEQAIDSEMSAGNIIAEDISRVPSLFLTPLYRAEVGVAAHLSRLMAGTTPWESVNTRQELPKVERKTRLTLSDSQRAAVAEAVNGKVTVITGGPGVGKTTVVNSILLILRSRNVKVLLCAPTGRAAKRLSETTGMEARTLHRTLEFDPNQRGFKRNADHPLDADLVVLDETSMVDVVLMNQLLRALPSRAALLMVGDVDQLPSVGPGLVLGDIIASAAIPTVRLTEIFRQATASQIIVNAHRINQGQMPERPHPGEKSDFYLIFCKTPEEIRERLLESVTKRIPDRFGLDPIRDVQVLTPMNRGALGARSLNVELQGLLNPSGAPQVERFGSTYAPGDKVIQTVNNYDKEVFNGDIGTITRIDSEESLLWVNYDGRAVEYEFAELDEVALAYATTIHKSQGSEYPAVVIPLATQHYMMLERNLLYTAVTRGRRLVVLVVQPQALAIAVKNLNARQRLTNLQARLKKMLTP
ncbi:ATP-dependent RecD-like DNA helicase [Gammaproteobacteria bacterium]